MREGMTLGLVFAMGQCSAPSPAKPPPQDVIVRVTADPDTPVAGAELRYRDALAAKTDAVGEARLALQAHDGDVIDVFVKCPEGHRSPTGPLQVRFQRLSGGSRPPEYAVSCPPEQRTIVIAVRAGSEAGLPLSYLGREIAQTDASGAASALLRAKPHEKLSLTLLTKQRECEQVSPEDPSWEIEVEDRDRVIFFDVQIKRDQRRCRIFRPRPPQPRKI